MFVTGASNGGHLSIRLAEETPELISGFGSIAAANATEPQCTIGSTPVPALFIAGTADPLMPYEGGPMVTGAPIESAEATALYWAERNDAALEPTLETLPDVDPTDGSTIEVRSYDGAVPVLLYTVVGGGHTEPSLAEHLRPGGPFGSQNRDAETAELVWEFFSSL